jgi:hypothetical protein
MIKPGGAWQWVLKRKKNSEQRHFEMKKNLQVDVVFVKNAQTCVYDTTKA